MAIKKTFPLILSVKTDEFRQDDPANELAASKYGKIRRKVLEDYNYTCQGCGFKALPKQNAHPLSLEASGYLEAHHLHGHKENDPKNITLLCPFCHMICHIGFSAHKNRFALIYFPWLKQAEINLLTTCCGVAIYRKGKYSEDAKSLLKYIESFDNTLRVRYGDILADPIKLSMALGTLGRKNKDLYEKRGNALADFRILPDISKFPKQFEHWSNTSWLKGPTWEEMWRKIYKQWEKKVT